MIPWGIDPSVFSLDAPPLHLDSDERVVTDATFKFLFVGGTIHRKGFDRLLEAYQAEFRRDEDVCLVVKDQGTDSFYRFGNARDAIQAASGPARWGWPPRGMSTSILLGRMRSPRCGAALTRWLAVATSRVTVTE